jgi:cytochrome c oxidase subunit 1
MTAIHEPRPARDRIASLGLILVGVVCLIAATVSFATQPSASFGWTAYVPLSTTTFGPTSPFGSSHTVVGLVLIGVGLIALSLRLGMVIGHRMARPS